jgi:hypothetical protein
MQASHANADKHEPRVGRAVKVADVTAIRRHGRCMTSIVMHVISCPANNGMLLLSPQSWHFMRGAVGFRLYDTG